MWSPLAVKDRSRVRTQRDAAPSDFAFDARISGFAIFGGFANNSLALAIIRIIDICSRHSSASLASIRGSELQLRQKVEARGFNPAKKCERCERTIVQVHPQRVFELWFPTSSSHL